MQILVRLPNWLGDVVISSGFLDKLRRTYPAAAIDVIVKKGLEEIAGQLEGIRTIHLFSKAEYKGLTGVRRYGKELSRFAEYDLFFCLPDSFSSALMAHATKAKVRIGYKKELRSFFLTHTYKKPKGLHRVEEYTALIDHYRNTNPEEPSIKISLRKNVKTDAGKYIVINLNSEAVSRRLPVTKGVELIELLQKKISLPIKLVGGPADADHTQQVYELLSNKNNIEMLAGKTTMQSLITLIQNAALMVSSDSGPAHIASAAGVPLVVIFGAGNENNTGPYHNPKARVVRHGQLPCEPCVSNTCKLGELPVCLLKLDMNKIINAVNEVLH